MNDVYRRKVALLIRIMPMVYRINDFAVHGGTAINLFYRNLERLSVDIDLTYIPIKDRDESLCEINAHLSRLKKEIEQAVPGIKVVHKPKVLKLECFKDGTKIKLEVNGTKRGVIEKPTTMQLCETARNVFHFNCYANIVSWSQLFGGKICAALSRQHPRDLFDCRGVSSEEFNAVKPGFMLCLLGSDKPIVESLDPNPIDQSEAMENQFNGMTDVPFTYADYETSRVNLISVVNNGLTEDDQLFLISFEGGNPDWSKCCAGDLGAYPSVKWKLQNIVALKQRNPAKHKDGIDKLRKHFKSFQRKLADS